MELELLAALRTGMSHDAQPEASPMVERRSYRYVQ